MKNEEKKKQEKELDRDYWRRQKEEEIILFFFVGVTLLANSISYLCFVAVFLLLLDISGLQSAYYSSPLLCFT